MNVVAILHSRAVAFSTRHRLQDQSVADRVRHCAVHRRRDSSDRQRARRVRSTVLRSFSFIRTSGSCWCCKPVCRVKESIPAAIWATPPAPLPHRVRGHPRLQHRQPKFASSVTRLGESAAIGHSPRGVFFDGTVLFPAELPAIDCRPTADMASRPRSSARLPCQALAQRIRRDAAV